MATAVHRIRLGGWQLSLLEVEVVASAEAGLDFDDEEELELRAAAEIVGRGLRGAVLQLRRGEAAQLYRALLPIHNDLSDAVERAKKERRSRSWDPEQHQHNLNLLRGSEALTRALLQLDELDRRAARSELGSPPASRSRRPSAGLGELSGEWWIDEDGNAMFADGDVGEMTHEMYVIDRLTREILELFGIEARDDYSSIAEYKDQLADQLAADGGRTDKDLWELVLERMREAQKWTDPKNVLYIARGHSLARDPRDYAMDHWGWIRVHGNNAQTTRALNPSILDQLARGLDEASGELDEEDLDEERVWIDTPQRQYTNVPLRAVLDRDYAQVMRHAERSWAAGLGAAVRGDQPRGISWQAVAAGLLLGGAFVWMRRRT